MFELLREGLRAIFGRRSFEDTLEELELLLLRSDVALPVAERITSQLREKRSCSQEALRGVLLDLLKPVEGFDFLAWVRDQPKPVRIVFLGVNGTGKTTTIAKIAKLLLRSNFSVVMAAADTFRAAGIEQLEEHGRRLGVRVIKHRRGADAAAVVYDAIEHAKARGIDVVLADTAGRMQTNVDLMNEMKKICRVAKPHLKLLVVDALAGHDALEQARSFDAEVGVDGVVVAKLDADAKGGCIISLAVELQKPIVFVGTGQSYEDLEAFCAESFVKSLLT